VSWDKPHIGFYSYAFMLKINLSIYLLQMILLFTTFLTSKRMNNVPNYFPRYDVFKYMLYSYRNIPFSEIYLFILLDDEFSEKKDELTNYIYETFSNLTNDKIHITYDRYTRQEQWIPFITHLIEKHGINETVFFMQNDDHIFVDFNMDILNEGVKLLESDPNEYKCISISHWPESIKYSGRYSEPILKGNYLNISCTALEGMRIFNMKTLHFIYIQHKWKNPHIRIDELMLSELTTRPIDDDFLSMSNYIPLRELVRHFDGYDHVQIDRSAYPPLKLPSNTFSYSKETLRKKMTAHHVSSLTQGNNFQIPEKWIDINLSLHPPDFEYTL